MDWFKRIRFWTFGLCGLLVLSGCLVTGQTIAKNFKCPEQFGYYADTEDCTKYFVCVFGDALHESCTGGLYFSAELQTCDWPRNVECATGLPPAPAESPAVFLEDDEIFSSSRRTNSNSTPKDQEVIPSRQKARLSNTSRGTSSRGGPSHKTLSSAADFTTLTRTSATALRTSRPRVRPTTISFTTTTTPSTTTTTTTTTTTPPPTPPSTALAPRTTALQDFGRPRPSSEDKAFKPTYLAEEEEDRKPPSNRFPTDDPEQPQFDEAVPPVVDSQGGIHINDGPGGTFGLPPRGSSLSDLRVYIRPIYGNNGRQKDGDDDRSHGYRDSGLDRETDSLVPVYSSGGRSKDLDRTVYNNNGRHRDPDVAPVVFTNNGHPRDPDVRNIFNNDGHSRTSSSRGTDSSSSISRPRDRSRNTDSRVITSNNGHSRDPDVRVISTNNGHSRDPDVHSSSSYRSDNPPRSQTTVLIPLRSNNGNHKDPDADTVYRTNGESGRRERPRGRNTRPRQRDRNRHIINVDNFDVQYDGNYRTPPTEDFDSKPKFTVVTQDFSREPKTDTIPPSEPPYQFDTPAEKDFSNFGYSGYRHTGNDYETSTQQEPPATQRPRSRKRTTTTTTTTTVAPTTQRSYTRGLPRGISRPATRPPSAIVTTPPSPPARPPNVYPTPQPFSTATKCDPKKCRLPDCHCGATSIPGGIPSHDVPQVVLLTFDDAVNDLNYEIYEEIFHTGRKNPNGCPIRGTFYVSHEWTDYGQVQTLYSLGHEMASHSITHSYGEKFSKSQWHKEIHGQREILHLYGGVKLEDIRGMRAPFLQIGGNKMFEMLHEANFTYDSSMPVFDNSPPFWPYTLDYAINHECMITPCPTKSFPGIWEIGMVMWVDLRGGRCSMGDACSNPSDEEGVYKMLIKNFNRHYKSNRAPFGLFYHSAWFNTQHHRRGFIRFLDEIVAKGDVWLITNWQLIQWLRNPTPSSKINDFEPWQCKKNDRPPPCHHPTVCNAWYQGGVRYMKTCQQCPNVYPWVGNTGFGKSKS